MITLLAIKLADDDVERVRRNHHSAIAELQAHPLARLQVIADRELADGVVVKIAHRLGRAPAFLSHSPPRGAATTGRIEEVRDGIDRTTYVALKASDWGASITVDVYVA